MTWIDPDFPKTATPSDRVGRVLGLNPGKFTGPGTNTYLVGRRRPILIDTGAGEPGYLPLFLEYLEHRGWPRPERILLTHRHPDHLGGVAHLRERFPGLRVSKMVWKDANLPDGVEDLREGEVIEGDEVTLVPVHTPGHASDHLCYFLREERALFSGDLILNGSTSVIPDGDGDLAQYMASLERVRALGVERIYPAHGAVIEDGPGKIAEYVEHRLMRERQILDAMAGGARTIPAIVAIIYADVPETLHAAAGMSVHSHLKKLRADGRVTEAERSGEPSLWTLV